MSIMQETGPTTSRLSKGETFLFIFFQEKNTKIKNIKRKKCGIFHPHHGALHCNAKVKVTVLGKKKNNHKVHSLAFKINQNWLSKNTDNLVP